MNGIGSLYLNEGLGISWISNMIDNNKDLKEKELEKVTIKNLEKLMRKYIHKNKDDIKKTQKKKQDVLRILDLLISNDSDIGYMLREKIL